MAHKFILWQYHYGMIDSAFWMLIIWAYTLWLTVMSQKPSFWSPGKAENESASRYFGKKISWDFGTSRYQGKVTYFRWRWKWGPHLSQSEESNIVVDAVCVVIRSLDHSLHCNRLPRDIINFATTLHCHHHLEFREGGYILERAMLCTYHCLKKKKHLKRHSREKSKHHCPCNVIKNNVSISAGMLGSPRIIIIIFLVMMMMIAIMVLIIISTFARWFSISARMLCSPRATVRLEASSTQCIAVIT